MELKIPFNKPFVTGKEADYIQEVLQSGKLAGNGEFTKKCQHYFQDHYHFRKCLMTTSCTDALEMAAILLDIQPGDEVIMPAYTFVSTANAFVLRGAKIVFADSRSDHPGIDEQGIENLITSKTKAIVVVHYAGVACDLDTVMDIANRHGLWVIEDAAQAIDAYYQGKALGGIGHLAAFSFHETKNIVSGEGGMLVINDERFAKRAEIIWEKGTNRSAFFRGEVDKYGWVDIGSSFLPSELIAAFLYAQLESLERIQQKRIQIWNTYWQGLQTLAEQEKIRLPFIPKFASNNGHMFYILLKNQEERSALIAHLKANGIQAVFHYLSLNESPYYEKKGSAKKCLNSDQYTNCLLRLPLFFELSEPAQSQILLSINHFFSH